MFLTVWDDPHLSLGFSWVAQIDLQRFPEERLFAVVASTVEVFIGELKPLHSILFLIQGVSLLPRPRWIRVDSCRLLWKVVAERHSALA